MYKRIFNLMPLFVGLLFLSNATVAQTVKFSDIIIPGFQSRYSSNRALAKTTSAIIIREVVVIAVDSNASSTILPSWYNDLISTNIPAFFAASTFNNYNYNISVLKRNATNAFRMPRYYLPFHGGCEHVHSETNIRAVLASADSIYNFNNYDFDGNGIVDVHFCSIGSLSGGVVGSCFTYQTNDTTSSGQRINISINKQTRGSSSAAFETVYYHETGHEQFDFPDTDHAGLDDYAHYGLGGFDVMTNGGGFQGQPSPYSPILRHIRSWFTPVSISSSSNGVQLQDFQMDSTCYVYTPSSLPSGTLADQKFYISYHKYDVTNNPLYRRYPYIDPNKGGILIWHSRTNELNAWTDFSDWRIMPIDIEAAHGKTNWQETSNNVVNTGVENPLTGRDKLEIRKITSINGNDTEIAGPYFQSDHGDGTVLYTPDDGKIFTLFTNPNSNWYNSAENYSQNKSSGFSVKNIRTSSGNVYADFALNDYTVSSNTILRTGTWYFYGNVTINSGITLTIEPGAILYFSSGVTLTVNGTLNSLGTSTANVIFDRVGSSGSWGGIVFNSGSGGNLDWSVIKNVQTYGGGAIVINGCSPTIQNCTIEDNTGATSGIQVFSNGSPYIYNNIIRNNTEHGIYVSHSNPYIRYNVITGSTSSGKASVYCYNYANPLFAAPGGGYTEGKNTLQNGYYGIAADYFSTPSAGSSSIAYNNRFINNSQANAYANYYSTIYAQYAWWGSSTPDQSKIIATNGSTITWSQYLTSDPGASRAKIYLPNPNEETLQTHLSITKSVIDNGTKLYKETASDELVNARDLRFAKNYNEAVNIYKSILSSKPASTEAKIALVELGNTYAETKDEQIAAFIKNYSEMKNGQHDLKPISMEVLSKIYTGENKNEEALEINKKLLKEYNGKDHELYAAINMFFIYYNNGKYELAKEMLTSLKSKYQDNPDVKAAEWLLYTSDVLEVNLEQGKDIVANPEAEIQTDTQLLDNYPNPFNPSTTIRYQIPVVDALSAAEVHVTLKIYDVLGREVATLVDQNLKAGSYEIDFNASSLPSGIYFYNLIAGTKSITKKMVLTK